MANRTPDEPGSFFTWTGWLGYPPRLPGPDPANIGTAQHYHWLLGVVRTIFALNLLDGLFTLAWVSTGDATERNALMHDLVHFNPIAFIVAKVLLVSLGTILLWRYRRNRLSVIAIFLTFLCYFLVLLYHLEFLSMVLFTA